MEARFVRCFYHVDFSSVYRLTTSGYLFGFRDETRKIFLCEKDLGEFQLALRGWGRDGAQSTKVIFSLSKSVLNVHRSSNHQSSVQLHELKVLPTFLFFKAWIKMASVGKGRQIDSNKDFKKVFKNLD